MFYPTYVESYEFHFQYTPAPASPKFAPQPIPTKKITAACISGVVWWAAARGWQGGSGFWGERHSATSSVVGRRQ
jgi:hypothetical protein